MPRKSDWIAASAIVVVGVLIATLPHLLAWSRVGDPTWISDNDDKFYLAVGGQAYDNHPTWLSDPVRSATDGPSLYKPLPLVPGVLAAKASGLGPGTIGFFWRVFAGVTVALGWYILFRHRVSSAWVAAGLAAIFLVDSGLLDARPLVGQAVNVARVVTGKVGKLYDAKPHIHGEWRITTPGVTMAFLALAFWGVDRARAVPSRGRIIAAGALFGLLFHVYFYYWTAFGLALVIALAADAGHRRVYFHVGWIGGLIGLPSVISDALMKRNMPPDWLPRTDKFLPIGHFEELLIPNVAVILLVLALIYVAARRRDLIFAGALGAAGLLLANHQVLTGLQIENFHWEYIWGPVISLTLVLAVAAEVGDRTGWSRRARIGLGVVTLAMVGSGLWLRWVEVTRTREPLENIRQIAEYRRNRGWPEVNPLRPNAVIGGDADYVNLASILDNLRPLATYCCTLSPTVTDAELDRRIVLNALLLGRDRAGFEADQTRILAANVWGPWAAARSVTLRDARLAARIAAFDAAAADFPAALDEFSVVYAALPASSKPAYLDSGWSIVEAGPTWDVWQRLPAP